VILEFSGGIGVVGLVNLAATWIVQVVPDGLADTCQTELVVNDPFIVPCEKNTLSDETRESQMDVSDSLRGNCCNLPSLG